MDLGLEDKTAIITGGSAGIGLACAKRFAAEGAVAFGADIQSPTPENWQEVSEAMPASSFQLLDVTDEEAIKTTVDRALAAHGRIDILVNSAGVAGVDILELA